MIFRAARLLHGLYVHRLHHNIASRESEEDFNFRPPSFLSALASRSPLSFDTTSSSIEPIAGRNLSYLLRQQQRRQGTREMSGRRRWRRSRKDEEDDDNGGSSPMSGLWETAISIGHCAWKPGSVSNHRGRVSLYPVLRPVSLTLSLSRPRSLRVSPAISFPFPRPHAFMGPDDIDGGPDSRQDYPVNNAPNLPRDLSCIIAKLFQPACLLLGFFDSLSLSLSRLLDEKTAPSRAPRSERYYLAFASPGRRRTFPSVALPPVVLGQNESERERDAILLRSMMNSYVH